MRLIALAICFFALVFWLFGGAHTGWTKTYDTRMEVDPVTTLEFPVQVDKLTVGVDFLGGAGLLALLLFALSFLFRKKRREMKPEAEPEPSS